MRQAHYCLSAVIALPLHCNGKLSPVKLGFDYVVTGNWVRAKWFAASAANVNKESEI